ncbi:MAG: hypothetical protein AAGG02_03000 [Cyanobacteria bacterium P01_H01_bin.15]
MLYEVRRKQSGTVEALVTDALLYITADLFVDATGFYLLLLG